MCVLSYTAWALRRDGYSSQLFTRSLVGSHALVYAYVRTAGCQTECMISQQFTRARITSRLIGEIGR